MRVLLTIFVGLALLVLCISLTAAADPASPDHKPVCIRSYEIDHTETPDDSTILFYMRGHKVWRNTLINRCVGLRMNSRGFTYSPTNPGTDEICSNLLSIRLNDTGQTCLLGDFTLVTPAVSADKSPQ